MQRGGIGFLAALTLLGCETQRASDRPRPDPAASAAKAPAARRPAAAVVASGPVTGAAASGPAGSHAVAFEVAGEGPVDEVVRRVRARESRPVVVYVGATWCEPCMRFHRAAEAGELEGRMAPVLFVEFNKDRDDDRLKAAGYRSSYIPLFALPGPDGTALGPQIEGSIKGPGAVDEIVPRLTRLLSQKGQ
jgi:thiol-disulfide isomerase/thioredoxin